MDNLYRKNDLKQPSFIQRIFKSVPKENAITEINNLLATRPLLEIKIEDIEAISSKYKVDLHKKFADRLQELYVKYLEKCFKDNVLTETELIELNHLKQILILKDKEVKDLHDKLASEIYKRSYEKAIEDGKYEKSKEIFIETLQKNLRLPDVIANKIISESRNVFMDAHLKKIISDERVSPNEWNEFETIAKNLNVQISIDEATKGQLEKMKLYWLIENGDLPVIEVPINLQKNEQCYYSAYVDWLEHRTITKRINYGGPTMRIRIMKGVYYKAGSLSVQRITSEVLQTIDSGTIYITNKRIIFDGNRKNTNIQLKKILSLTPYSDGVGIEKDSGKSPILRVTDNADILAMTIGRVISDL